MITYEEFHDSIYGEKKGDIHSKAEYPMNELSNFASHSFVFDGQDCAGMEGFLQSLKFKNVVKQAEICGLSGKNAKKAGSHKRLWKLTGNVWWKGEKIKRTSDRFQELIDDAYDALFQNENFRKALKDSGTERLCHSIGTKDSRKTILTEYEFVSRLMKLRKKL